MTRLWPSVAFGQFLRPHLRPYTLGPTEDANLVGMRLYGTGPFHRELKPALYIAKKSHFVIKAGDVIYNKLFAWKGTFGVVPPSLDGMFVSDKFPTYELDATKVDASYLAWYFRCPPLWEQARQMSTGSAALSKLTLNPPKFLLLRMPLPPLEEQRRIVARIEELAGTIERARDLHKASASEIGAFMQSARNNAMLGYESSQPRVALSEICTNITDGPHVSPAYVEAGIPFISVRNISEFGLDFSTAKYVSPEDHELYSKKARVERGDVLYTKGGTTGVARRVDTDRPFSIWVHVALLKLNKERACPAFVEHALNSPRCKKQALQFTHGSSNKDLGLTRMCNIVFPLPPLPEQEAAVGVLDDFQDRCLEAAAEQRQAAAELNALLPSILDKAFKGEF